MFNSSRAGFWADASPALPPQKSKREAAVLEPQAAHDLAHGPAHKWARIRSGWNAERLMPSVPLTDARIEARMKQGYYSDAYREAIRRKIESKKVRLNVG